MLDNQHEVLIKGSKNSIGTGHNSEIVTDRKGQDQIFYHAVKVSDPVGRVLMLAPVNWENGWPEIEGGIPSTERKVPTF